MIYGLKKLKKKKNEFYHLICINNHKYANEWIKR